MDEQTLSDADEEKSIPKWFYLPYCDECEKYIEFVDNKCSNYRSRRLVVTFNYLIIVKTILKRLVIDK